MHPLTTNKATPTRDVHRFGFESADAAGYSRLTGQNEERTRQQLNTGINILSSQAAV